MTKYWQTRTKLKNLVRKFFDDQDYLELDTPIAVICPGTEVHLQYFETTWIDHQKKQHSLFLRSSPELHMKRALAEGIERIYQFATCFRNGGEFSEWHNPEFTMLEWYELEQSYHGLINQTEDLIRYTIQELRLPDQSQSILRLPKRIERVGVFDAFREFANIELIDQDPDLAKKCIDADIISVSKEDDFETAYFKTLIEKVEPALNQMGAAVLMDYPPSQAALAAVKEGKAQRFEFYIGRVELCNGFYELVGEAENRARIGEALNLRKTLGMTFVPEDEAFYEAMGKLTKPCAGNALGFDRLLALLCSEQSLDHILPFRKSFFKSRA